MPTLIDVLYLVGYNGYTAEADAASTASRELMSDDRLWRVTVDLHHGARGRTRLMAAACVGDVARVHRLLEVGSDPSLLDCDGASALHWALMPDEDELELVPYWCQECALTLVRAMAARGDDVDGCMTDNDIGATPLYLAAQYGYLDVVDALLAAGANPDTVVRSLTTSDDGDTPLVAATIEGNMQVVRRLMEAGATVCPRAAWAWVAVNVERDGTNRL